MTDTFDRLDQTRTKAESKSGFLSPESLSEFASSLSAGVSGAVTFSLVAASRSTPLAIPVAMLAGGLTKYAMKSGLEHLFVDKEQRTAGLADVGWGAVDGLAGITASMADRYASQAYLNSIAKRALGTNISTELAGTASKQLIAGDAIAGIKHGLLRGMAGGSVGSFTWSVPHRLYEHADDLRNNAGSGALATSKDILVDTLTGTALGGIISGGGTGLVRSSELLGRARSALTNEPPALQMRTLHLNDFHSQNDQLAAIKGVSDQLLADAKAKGLAAQFVTVGDLEGCNVQYISTKSGMPENSALMKMGVTKFVPGNHTYDLGSGFNVPGYARTMNTLLQQHPDASLIATNLDLSAFPEYEQIAKRFTIDTIHGPNGPEKVATLGLVTKEGTSLGDVPGIGYKDAKDSAVQTMLELSKNQGVNKFVILSHLGMGEDQALAQSLVRDSNLASNNLKVAAIIGAHTHDVTPAPLWVGQNGVSTGGLSSIRNNLHGGYEIPIVQAGSNGRWLGQLDLSIRADGAADRFRTIGRMHAISPSLPRDAAMDAYVRSQTSELSALRNTDYNARILGNLSADNLRKGETALGNIVSDAIDKQVHTDAVLTHSGWMRTGLEANVDPATGQVVKPVTRETVADMFKSGGDAELEKAELHGYKMRGNELRVILESSVSMHPTPELPSFGQRLRNAFSSEPLNANSEGHGYFLQPAGLKYQFDLSKPVGERIGSILIRNPAGEYVPINPTQEYSIASRRFIFDKWSRLGAFGDRTIERSAVGKSPVEMVGEFIQGRTIDPSSFQPEGRITDLTPKAAELPLKVGPTILAPALSEAARTHDQGNK